MAYNLPYALPNPPKPKEIANYGLPRDKRKFPYHNFKRFKDLERIYYSYRDENKIPPHIREEYESFVDQEWDRRINGFWFFNGDKLEYITGKHYCTLQWWQTNIAENGRNTKGNPKFVDAQRDVFYAWDIVSKDPNCFGLCLGTCRRFGKTIVASAIGYWDTTEYRDSRMAIQSKTEPDGKKIFNKIVRAWQSLPKMFVPEDNRETKVARILDFSEGKRKLGRDEELRTYIETIDSQIWYESSKEEALDGDYCSFIYIDEAGKTVECNVNVRWGIQKECLAKGSEIVGKALMTTTVEDMEKKGGRNFKAIWDKSDHTKKDEFTGQTGSGLYRMFIPSDYGYMGKHPVTGVPFVDEFGYSDRAAAKKFIEQMIDNQQSGADRISYRRKYPLYEDDMFLVDSSESPFNLNNLYNQRKYNDEQEVHKHIRVGNLYWSEKDKTVTFNDNPNGKWKIWGMPDPKDQNKMRIVDGVKFPARTTFRLGIDPVDDKSPTSGKGSDYAAYVVAKPSTRFGNRDIIPVCQYLTRTKNPEEMWEDMILTAVFYSCYVNPEQNKYGTSAWFNLRGFDGYTIFNPYDKDAPRKGKKGTPTTDTKLKQSLVEKAAIHSFECIGFHANTQTFPDFPFNELLEDMINFDKFNWTPSDATVAWMMALVCCDFNPSFSELGDMGGADYVSGIYDAFKGGRAKFN